MKTRHWTSMACTFAFAMAGCAELLGLDGDREARPEDGAGGAGGCEPLVAKGCYEGPTATEGIGECHAGAAVCQRSGVWGACLGQQLPTMELCDGLDNDCNGIVDDGALANAPPCTTGLSGSCSAGMLICQDGKAKCVPSIALSAELCLNGADENCDGDTNCSGSYLASRVAGVEQSPGGIAIAVDAAGNAIVAGSFTGTINWGNGPVIASSNSDFFVAKLGPTLDPIWTRQYAAISSKSVTDVEVDAAGNIVIAGYFDNELDLGCGPMVSAGFEDVYVAKLNADGACLWSKSFGGSAGQNLIASAIDMQGNVIITCTSTGVLNLGGQDLPASGFDIFLAKYDVNGAHLWSRVVQSSGDEVARDIAIDLLGNIIIGGEFSNKFELDNQTLLPKGSLDAFVVKFTPDGTSLWGRAFGGTNNERIVSVDTDSQGRVLFAGNYQSAMTIDGQSLPSSQYGDLFLASLDSDGNGIWARGAISQLGTDASQIRVDAADQVLLIGGVMSSFDLGAGSISCVGNPDVAVAKFDITGSQLWAHCHGDGYGQHGIAIAADPLGHAFLGGWFRGKMQFDNTTLSTLGAPLEYSAFIVKLMP